MSCDQQFTDPNIVIVKILVKITIYVSQSHCEARKILNVPQPPFAFWETESSLDERASYTLRHQVPEWEKWQPESGSGPLLRRFPRCISESTCVRAALCGKFSTKINLLYYGRNVFGTCLWAPKWIYCGNEKKPELIESCWKVSREIFKKPQFLVEWGVFEGLLLVFCLFEPEVCSSCQIFWYVREAKGRTAGEVAWGV